MKLAREKYKKEQDLEHERLLQHVETMNLDAAHFYSYSAVEVGNDEALDCYACRKGSRALVRDIY